MADSKTRAFIAERLNDDKADQPKLSKEVLRSLREHGLQKVASHCAAMGIFLHDDEVRFLMGPDKLTKTASANYEAFDRELLATLQPFLPDRSMFEPHFTKRAAARKGKKLVKKSRTDDANMFAELFDVPTINKLANVVDNNMTIRFAYEPEVFTRVFTPADTNPKWLPFMLALQA